VFMSYCTMQTECVCAQPLAAARINLHSFHAVAPWYICVAIFFDINTYLKANKYICQHVLKHKCGELIVPLRQNIFAGCCQI